MVASTPASGHWLSLQEASDLLQVHPTTLRQWADRGQVRVFRTPGGHRRFDESDVRRLLKDSGTRRLDLMVDAAVGRARLESSDGRLDAEAWYRRLDEGARESHRALGRDLLLALRTELESPDPVVPPRSAVELGSRYAELSFGAGLTVAEAMRAFLRFQEMVAAGIRQLAGLPAQGGEADDLDRRAAAYVNEVLIAMVDCYVGFGEVGT